MKYVFRVAPHEKTLTFFKFFSIFALIMAILIFFPIDPTKGVNYLGVSIIVIIALYIVIHYLLSPKQYEFGLRGIIIRRPLKSVEIPYSDIKEVRHDPYSLIGALLPIIYSGPFGYIGDFYSEQLGKCVLYVTNRDFTTLVGTKSGKTYILSPESPDSFIQLLKEKAPDIQVD